MSIQFRFEVDGEVQLLRAFNRIENKINDLRPVWDEAQKEFFFIEREQFRTEGGAGESGKWRPLSKPYAEIKRKAVGNKPILERSGALMKSLTAQSTDTIIYKGEQEAIFGSRVPYGIYHQRGGAHLPQRKPIDMSEKQRRAMQKAIQRGLIAIIRKDPGVEIKED